MKLVDGTDAPLANETITITVGGNKYKGNYTTDELGQSWFSIDTASFTDLSLEIRVSGRDRGKPLSFSSTGEMSIHGLSVFSANWKIRQVSCGSPHFSVSSLHIIHDLLKMWNTEHTQSFSVDFIPDFVWL